jgi:diguanylate cyclase (GGDEF)-like protein
MDAMARSVFVFAPIYRADAALSTAIERHAASIGWVGAAVDVGYVLDQAIADRTGLVVSLSRDGMTPVVAGDAKLATHGAAFSDQRDISADGAWTITMAGDVDNGGLSPNAQSAVVLTIGLLVTALLYSFLRTLAGSHNRALDLVDKTTGELRHQALHDSLTGLPNRALVLDRAEQLLVRARREHTEVALLFIDLDNFKDINDSLGHAAGDELLGAVAARFQAALRQTDTVGRLGGDEFVVVAEGESLAGGPELVAQRLLDVMREPFHLGQSTTDYIVTASIGVACGDRADPQDLLRDADIALYEAKDAGKNCFVFFAAHMLEDVDSRTRVDIELRGALAADQFVLFYQPTFRIHDTATTGVEALLRWNHPTRGLLGPDAFLPMLESTGLIVSVGGWVLREACRQGAEWHRGGFEITMSVNASARQLTAHTLITDVAAALALSHFDPSRLVIEITESTLMRDTTGTIAELNALKALGVRIAIDDFGTGYSSLAYLRQFPVDILKIDRSFIADITQSHESAALVHTLIQLGKSLGLETVAEGIEHTDQLDRLQGEECDSGQGFLMSKPVPADQMTALLRRTAGPLVVTAP